MNSIPVMSNIISQGHHRAGYGRIVTPGELGMEKIIQKKLGWETQDEEPEALGF